jgi:hypothetical protein
MPRLPRYPIYIPSKGRATKLKTGKMFDRDGVPYKVVVEPSQVPAYTEAGHGDRLLVLPENGKGLVYSRNWITDYSRAQGEVRHWQIDDDIDEIYQIHKGFRIRCDSAIAFAASEDFADRYENVALLSLNSFFFVPISKGGGARHSSFPPFYLNHRCYTIILFLNALPNRWRPPNNEDADMSLQVLADGWCTILLNAFLIDTETTMLAKGGQTEAFKAGGRLQMVRALERKWPGVVTVGRRFGHPQHFIKNSWTKFDNKLRLKPGIDLAKMEPNDYGITLRALRPVKSKRLRKLMREARKDG